jgi:hypothetical protein
MPIWFITAVTCLIELKNERISVTANSIPGKDSKPTLFGDVVKTGFPWGGLQNSSPENRSSSTLDSPLARRSPIAFVPGATAQQTQTQRILPETQKFTYPREDLDSRASSNRSLKPPYIGHWQLETPLAVAKHARRCKWPCGKEPYMPSWRDSKQRTQESWCCFDSKTKPLFYQP